MNIGDLMTFVCPADNVKDRQRLPCFRSDVIGRPIECSDQVDVLRVFPGDRVRIEELRDGYALVTHSSCKGIVALVSCSLLEAIPLDLQAKLPTDPEEAAKW